MSDIDFQNGFIVGMATRGITRSGLMYEPLVWNDSGVFSCFYIDFKKPVSGFSLGILTESVIVHDSVQLPITGFAYVSPGVYKIFVDISGKTRGVTVLLKVTSYLAFADGKQIPPFSVHFYVAGIDTYVRLKYLYESADIDFGGTSAAETRSEELWDSPEAFSLSESGTYPGFSGSPYENATLVLI